MSKRIGNTPPVLPPREVGAVSPPASARRAKVAAPASTPLGPMQLQQLPHERPKASADDWLRLQGKGAGANKGDAITIATHPEWFTPAGERKWKVAPPGAEVVRNTTGKGDWIEKWQNPRTGAWVHNYTRATMVAKAGEKFVRVRDFAANLPQIRKQYRADLTGDGSTKVVALLVALVDQAYFRIGNSDSEKRGVFGISTMQRRHVEVAGDTVTFDYVGKKRVEQHKVVCDPTIAGLIRELVARSPRDDAPLFAAAGRTVDAGTVNQYLKQFGDFSIKDFRTYHATRLVRQELLRRLDVPSSARQQVVEQVFAEVAPLLGHTPAVCKSSYVDPTVVEKYLRGKLRRAAA